MKELLAAIPDADVLLALEPEELAGKILFFIKERKDGSFHPKGSINELEGLNPSEPGYPREKKYAIELAMAEAWHWLNVQGLILPTESNNGWMRLSRRGHALQTHTEFTNFWTARYLPKDHLHRLMPDTVWSAYIRGDYELAALSAMKAVEVKVREASSLPNSAIGTALMADAFNPTISSGRGQLTDTQAEAGEKTARMQLFMGAIGSFRNPLAHRDVDLNDPLEAMEIILFANMLLRIVETRALAIDVNL